MRAWILEHYGVLLQDLQDRRQRSYKNEGIAGGAACPMNQAGLGQNQAGDGDPAWRGQEQPRKTPKNVSRGSASRGYAEQPGNVK